MTELFVLTLCLHIQGEPCMKSAQAYYQYSGLDKKVEDLSKEHKELVYVGSVVGVINNRKFSFPLYKNIIYKYEYNNNFSFINYEYGF